MTLRIGNEAPGERPASTTADENTWIGLEGVAP